MARRILIFAAALALLGEVFLAVVTLAGFYGFVSYGDGMKFAGMSTTVLQAIAIVLPGGVALLWLVGALVLLMAAFGKVLNPFMQGLMMGIASLQLFITIVITGLTGWTQLFVLGGVFVLLAGALAVTVVTADRPDPEPGPVAPASV